MSESTDSVREEMSIANQPAEAQLQLSHDTASNEPSVLSNKGDRGHPSAYPASASTGIAEEVNPEDPKGLKHNDNDNENFEDDQEREEEEDDEDEDEDFPTFEDTPRGRVAGPIAGQKPSNSKPR